MKKGFLLLIIFLMIFGCGKTSSASSDRNKIDYSKPLSWGQKQTIYVFASDHVWKYAQTPLKKSLERNVFTTQNENYFDVKRADISAISQFYKYKNLIFLVNIAAHDSVSNYIKSRLNPAIIEDVKKKSVGLFERSDLWARDQQVVILIGDNERNLLKLNILQSEKIFEVFKQKLVDREAANILGIKTLPASTFEKFPFTLKIPKMFLIYKDKPEEHYISFIKRIVKDGYDRYVTVYYEKMDKDSVNADWLIKTRKKLAWKVYDEDEFSKDDIRIQKCKINKRKGWEIMGRWQNKKYYIGGTFQSFAFYDEKSHNAVIVDNSIYFPAGYKLTGLIQLQIISNTIEMKD